MRRQSDDGHHILNLSGYGVRGPTGGLAGGKAVCLSRTIRLVVASYTEEDRLRLVLTQTVQLLLGAEEEG